MSYTRNHQMSELLKDLLNTHFLDMVCRWVSMSKLHVIQINIINIIIIIMLSMICYHCYYYLLLLLSSLLLLLSHYFYILIATNLLLLYSERNSRSSGMNYMLEDCFKKI